ncbi:hypothetical protein WJX72_005276 [[Myrmecia] bisecta]|uniref:F-box protein n=1 Tax=[Myrmecia] bisecta TaxID=41462 RepID=A0AAW1PCM6_9CHLO
MIELVACATTGSLSVSDDLRLVFQNKRSVLRRDDGVLLHDSPEAFADSRGLTLLQAVGRLVQREGLAAVAKVLDIRQQLAFVKLQLFFPLRLWCGLLVWRPSSAAVLVGTHLHPCDEPLPAVVNPDGYLPSQEGSGAGDRQDAFSLMSCFKELPSCHADPDLPQPPAGDAGLEPAGVGLADLPAEILAVIVARLDAASLARLSASARYFRALAREAVPGLGLSLFPHQRAAVRWMLAREGVQGPAPDLCWRQLQTAEGLPFYLNAATGEFTIDPPSAPRDSKAGLVCDEPGLGKTISCLALILKTIGTSCAPPSGAAMSTVSWQGRKADAAVSAAAVPLSPPHQHLWVQCDLCNKWRVLPNGVVVEEGAMWLCQMHPDPQCNSCDVADKWQQPERPLLQMSGFASSPDQLGAADNVKHFKKLLTGFPEAAKDPYSVAWWLTRHSPEALRLPPGVQVPKERRSPPNWEALLAELGLEVAGGAARGRSKSGASGASAWRQPWYLEGLLMDLPALREALAAGPEMVERRIYLSSATLLVLPSQLIPHWLHQIHRHTQPGSLRVAVLCDRSAAGRGASDLAAHEYAWDYDLVITTFQRLSSDWTADSKHDSPLMQVHWLRIVLDEGHTLGANLAMTNRLQMACALRAERRWVLTGTPTPSTPTSHVAHLQPLLAFLHLDPFGTNRKAWEEAIQRPFEARQWSGRERLLRLLNTIMIRAVKADLVTIPPRFQKVTYLDFAPDHARSYNELVEVVERNLLLADWHDDDHVESLLNMRNAKWAKQMLHNVKMSCCLAGTCNLVAQEADLQETIDLLAARLGLPKAAVHGPPWVEEAHPLAGVEAQLRAGGLCQLCSAPSRLLIVTPCAHLLCVDCTIQTRLCCPLPSCQQAYRMQAVNEPERLATNPRPKWPVPFELIEWQPAYTQQGALGLSGGEWSANWQITKSTKCVHLLRRLYEIGAALTPAQLALQAQQAMSSEDVRLSKAIVFSQFWQHIQLIGAHLRQHGVRVAVLKKDLSAKDKALAVNTFQADSGCGVLLMDEVGSVGLDLSFASNVFLMEPLENGSLQEQVVARAHRMGATRPIHVETLVMKGTAEEDIVRLRDQRVQPAEELRPVSCPAGAGGGGGRQREGCEADRRGQRNHILLALRRVAVSGLAEFHDLPTEAAVPIRLTSPSTTQPAAVPADVPASAARDLSGWSTPNGA